jgi:two-component system, cell cycle sensor histidine kinase and response regulator CckA
VHTSQQSVHEAALRRFEELFDHVPVGLYRTTADGRIIQANLAMVHLLGCTSKEQLLSLNAQSFYVDLEARRTFKSELAAMGAIRDFETELKRADGRRIWVRINARAVREDTIPLVLIDGVMEDVTDRLRAEAALKESQERLRQSQKMEAIGRLAGGVAHDFNNLLTAIIGYSAFLVDDASLSGEARDSAAEIQKAAERAAALTQQLLTFSRRQVLQPADLDPDAVIEAMVPMLRRLIGEDIALSTACAAAPAAVRADRSQFEQVILNLALNARDAMPTGGALQIATSCQTLDDRAAAATASGLGAGDYVVVDVVDSGHGMTDEIRARIFDPYFTTKPAGKGTGLGLSTVYGIVQQCGGAVGCATAPGEGTTMRVMLPRSATATVPRPAPIRPSGAVGTETILVVEDEDVVRSFAAHALEARGYRVLVAADGREALATVTAHDGPLHLLLTDVVMPGISGVELAREVEQLRPGVAVIFMSGHTADAIGRYGMPATVLLLKPFTPEALGVRVREVLDARKG